MIILFVLYAGLFVGYSVIDYHRNDSAQGIITSIVIMILDLFILMMYAAKVSREPALIVLFFFFSRICIFCFGQDYWLFGFMIVYIVLGVNCSHNIAEKRFPFSVNFKTVDLSKI